MGKTASESQKPQSVSSDKLLEEVESVKRLLILLLAKLGSNSDEIGMALDIPQAQLGIGSHSRK